MYWFIFPPKGWLLQGRTVVFVFVFSMTLRVHPAPRRSLVITEWLTAWTYTLHFCQFQVVYKAIRIFKAKNQHKDHSQGFLLKNTDVILFLLKRIYLENAYNVKSRIQDLIQDHHKYMQNSILKRWQKYIKMLWKWFLNLGGVCFCLFFAGRGGGLYLGSVFQTASNGKC